MPSETPMDRAPLTYTDEELVELAAQVQALKNHPAWQTLGRILRDAIQSTHEIGFQHLDEIQRWAGRAEGLKQAWELPGTILAAGERVIRNEKARKEPQAARGRNLELGMSDDL